MNWLIELKLIFDSMPIKPLNIRTLTICDIIKIIEQKAEDRRLPLLSECEYEATHGNELGFSTENVISALKCSVVNEEQFVKYDDLFNMISKLQNR